ncbi:hypothetical protein [Uliginosibacterium aquaticum]|uniref:Uncharacterized protein n=1 Tax=Uliginosibacterium aquaticum TaxID=2731212 RepID=A0ABX2IEU1_9RHOO|nr:hypothetical protein [Uliginosibacterium aquaticum]NSL55204.1 hypothetical protein [Uliginosibacterium aquaticum]
MDPVVIQLLARIKIRLRQEKGVAVNTQRFFTDPAYACQVLDAAEDCEDLDLVTGSLEIRNRLGWIQADSLQSATASAPASKSSPAPEKGSKTDRYMFGARS